MNIRIGLTGGIGSGKSTVAKIFSALGAALIDIDQIAHQLTAAGGRAIPRIAQQFGPTVLTPDHALNRDQMRAHVFKHPEAKKQLEAILHPMIWIEAKQRALAAADAPYLLLDIPLLIESDAWRARVSRILVVDCCAHTQIARVHTRSGWPPEHIHAIMRTQASRAQRLNAADDVLVNEDSIDALRARVAQLHDHYVGLGRA